MVEDRREKILLKALELYMVEGYSNVSITDLQGALNMGRGTLYYYFNNKYIYSNLMFSPLILKNAGCSPIF